MNINYEISEIDENKPVGIIHYHYSGQTIAYYSEKKLLDAYKDCLDYQGPMGPSYTINDTIYKRRHGLRYALTEAEAGEYGMDYTKEEYEEKYKNLIKNKKKELER